MNSTEIIMKNLKSMGLRPELDEDGDVRVIYQSYRYAILVEKDNEGKDGYVTVVLLPFYTLTDKQEKTCALFVCNKANLKLKFVKVYVNEDMDSILASVEFVYNTRPMLEYNLKKAMESLSVIGPWCKHEMSNCLLNYNEE